MGTLARRVKVRTKTVQFIFMLLVHFAMLGFEVVERLLDQIEFRLRLVTFVKQCLLLKRGVWWKVKEFTL